jgi:hypothetical protein
MNSIARSQYFSVSTASMDSDVSKGNAHIREVTNAIQAAVQKVCCCEF